MQNAPADSYGLLGRYRYLRVVDVVDALDGIGYHNIGLMDPEIRPICTRHRGRTIIPGRIQVVEAQTTIACGGVQVRPGDGVLIVPQEVAGHAIAILIADMKDRCRRYEKLGMAPDESVDYEHVEEYHREHHRH